MFASTAEFLRSGYASCIDWIKREQDSRQMDLYGKKMAVKLTVYTLLIYYYRRNKIITFARLAQR